MKKMKWVLWLLLISFLQSCSTIKYYQVYKVTEAGDFNMKDSLPVYENNNCRITYDFWAEGGNMGFLFYNKTDENIYLNMEESFFIINGMANNYYKNRIYSSSRSTVSEAQKYVSAYNLNVAKSVSVAYGSQNSISYVEEKVVCIPAKTSKYIYEYKINESYISYCDLLKYPWTKQNTSKSFSKEESPLCFSNRLVYSIGENIEENKVENEFYVSEIANYPEQDILKYYYNYVDKRGFKFYKHCDQIIRTIPKHITVENSRKFYIVYLRGTDTRKH